MDSKMKKFLYIIPVIVLLGCKTAPPPIPATPVEPEWTTLTRAPVIEAYGDHTFRVTDELIKRQLEQEDFIKRFNQWKVIHKVP